jgi:hypothetical protein
MSERKFLNVLFVPLLISFTGCAIFNSSTQKYESIAYANAKYDVTLQRPKNWVAADKQYVEMDKFAINVFRKGTLTNNRLPLGVHADKELSYVTIWPHGLGTELPQSQKVSLKDTTLSLNFNFAVDKEESTLLLLKDGTIWAYFLKPEQPPASWSNYGFIFAQIRTLQSSIKCYDGQTGEQLSLKECDYSQKDQVIRTGAVDEKDAAAIQYILENISLEEVKK